MTFSADADRVKKFGTLNYRMRFRIELAKPSAQLAAAVRTPYEPDTALRRLAFATA